jgi:hypothetical protein
MSSLNLFAFVGRQDTKDLTVFGDRSTRDIDIRLL